MSPLLCKLYYTSAIRFCQPAITSTVIQLFHHKTLTLFSHQGPQNHRRVSPRAYNSFNHKTDYSCSTRKGSESEGITIIPDPPTNCCMSGCANCVWISYAQELADIYKDGGKASEEVMKAIDDPGLKIFLSFELKDLKA